MNSILLPHVMALAGYVDTCFLMVSHPFSEVSQKDIMHRLSVVHAVADALGLQQTGKLIARIREELKTSEVTDAYADKILEPLDNLQERIKDESESIKLLYIQPHLFKYYAPAEPLFGVAVSDRFPSATYDIEEAGKCFALGRNTAAVLHLMRVLEVGLHVLRKALKLPYDEKKSWNGVLVELKKWNEIEGSATKPKNWRRNRQFYSEAFVEFGHLKDAWRNHAMHARDKYDAERAENVMNHVGALMRHLATKLKE